MGSSGPGFRALRDLEHRELAEIIERIIEKTKEDTNYILRISIDSELECDYTTKWVEEIELAYGEADILELEYKRDGCREIRKLVVIPVTAPTVVVKNRMSKELGTRTSHVFVFNGSRWTRIEA